MSFSPQVGIDRLKKLLQTHFEQIPEAFYALEMRLAKNRRDASLFGDNDPSNRSELYRILFDLNNFALEHVKIAFSDLCESGYGVVSSHSVNEPQPVRSVKSEALPIPSHTQMSYLGTKRRWAVLVGVGEYDDKAFGDLSVCVGDVMEVARQLYSNESGFTPASIQVLVDDGIQPTRDAILSSLQKVAGVAEEDDLLLFYYSGHGELEREESYLITKDSVYGKLKDTALPVAKVEEIMQCSRAKAKVIILDACHAGEKVQSKSAERLPPKFLERVYLQAHGMVILASCAKNQKSYIWESKRCSAYTFFLLQALRGEADREAKGFVSVDDIDVYVTNGMASWTEKHHYQQTPTMHKSASGRIIVSAHKMHIQLPVQAETEAPPQQKQSLLFLTSSSSWKQSDTIKIRDEAYMLYKGTIQEESTSDGSAVLRSARAQQIARGNKVYVRQVSMTQRTSQSDALRERLKREHVVALNLAHSRDFPRILLEEGFSDETNGGEITLVYEAWVGPTLGEVFHRPGKVLGKAEIVPLSWSFVRVCEVINLLHRESCSHRALTAETIILPGGDRRRPVLRDFGLAGQKVRPGVVEQVQIQAPEQRSAVAEWSLPGARTDIYQLGVILYTLITGHPFSSARPRTYAGDLSLGIEHAIMRAVATKPKERWPSVMAFANELKQALRAKNE